MKTAVHHNSIEAYHGINLTERQKEVVRAFKSLGSATDRQIAEYLRMDINRICGRICELKEIDVVMEIGNIIGEFGKRVRLCRLKEKQEWLF